MLDKVRVEGVSTASLGTSVMRSTTPAVADTIFRSWLEPRWPLVKHGTRAKVAPAAGTEDSNASIVTFFVVRRSTVAVF